MELPPAPAAAAEAQRLRAPRRYDILDAPSEDAFDRVTALAARLLDVPTALIALVDENRVRHKSRPGTAGSEQLRDLSLCARVIGADGLCWVGDAASDPELASHPLVTSEFRLRFYAAAPLRAPDGRFLGALCVMDHRPRAFDEPAKASLRDLAGLVMNELELCWQARQRRDEDARRNEERFRELFELNPQSMWVYDLETLRFLEANAAAVRHYGYSREEFQAMGLSDIHPPEDVPALLDNVAKLNGREIQRESWRHRRKDGSVFEVEVSGSELHHAGRPARIVMAYDISARQETERTLELRDRHLAALVQIQRELLQRQDLSGGLDHILALLGEVSHASRVQHLAYDPDPAGQPVLNLHATWNAPEAPPAAADEIARWRTLAGLMSPESAGKIQRGEPIFVLYDTLPADERALFAACGACATLFVPLVASGRCHGTLVFEHCSAARPWSQAEADHLQAAGAALALALERDSAARALSDEKERLAVTLASVTEGVITTDLYSHVVLMNRVAEELTGWTTAEALGWPIREVFTAFHGELPQGGAPLVDSIAQVLATGRPTDRDRQVWLHSRDGIARRVAKSSAPVYDARGQVIGAVRVFRDITAQEKIAGELLKSSKLESIGTLAGGIAHDFNNILTAIIGNLSLAKTYNGTNVRAVAKLESAERACFRARDLTNQLLTFAKGGSPIKKLAQLEDTVRESVHFALHGAPVQCRFSFAENLWPVEADLGQISQVLNNLAINAVQSMPAGGFIEVRAENVVLEADHDLPAVQPGSYVKISVEDDGQGIAPEHLHKIFDPFFSTKENGSGLGLATSYSIIHKHGGHINVDSVREVGSIFRVYLPAVLAAPEAAAPPPPQTAAAPPADSSRVLVMDDEPSVRELAASMLTHLGREATVAADGAAALAAYQQAREEGRPFGAVILDLTVPGGMGGAETIVRLRELDPAVKAIVCSGYSNNPIMSDHRAGGFDDLLAKPYRVAELAAALERLRVPAGAGDEGKPG